MDTANRVKIKEEIAAFTLGLEQIEKAEARRNAGPAAGATQQRERAHVGIK